ncbi:MAG: tetratricopeptide repeat protein [Rikenellaceae bacterium]
MKKLTLFLVAFSASLMATTQVMAQRINAESVNSQLTKIDADLVNPKKNTKGATWLKHADAYYDAAKEPIKSLYVGSPMETVKMNFGKAKGSKKETVGGKEFVAWEYEYVTVYAKDDVVASWKQTKKVKEGAFDTAVESYVKAREVDPSVAAKSEAGLDKIVNHFRELGNIEISFENYPAAAEAYMRANKAAVAISEDKYDAKLVYTAGYLLTIDGGKNPESYVNGAKYLKESIVHGYDDIEMADESIEKKDKGGAHYYTFFCVMGSPGERSLEELMDLKKFMIEAVNKFPENENIMASLMQLYSTNSEIGEPEEVLVMIEKALAQNPDNLSVWYSRGRIYSVLKNFDECVKSFEQVIRIDPNGHSGYYYTGMFLTSKADEYNDVMKNKTYTKQADYDADLAILNSHYYKALPYLEKAMEIKPDDVTTAEYLKAICFRMRDEEGMMDKYNKYNDIYKSLTGQ